MFEEILAKAKRMAVQAHGEQRYGDHSYAFHLAGVYANLLRFGVQPADAPTHSINNNLLLSAWLHDTLEDTPLTRAEVAGAFGDGVADLVWRVTDEQGGDRAERKRATLPRIAQSIGAIVLKLADRIANVEFSASQATSSDSKYGMYLLEWPEFQRHLAAGLENQPESPLKVIARTMLAHLGSLLSGSSASICFAEPTACHLWTQEPLTQDHLRELFETVEAYREDSHWMTSLVKCSRCGQQYFKEFYEEIDWQGGNDPQFRTYIPVSSPQDVALLKQVEHPARLLRFFPRLQEDWPKGAQKAAIRWMRGLA